MTELRKLQIYDSDTGPAELDGATNSLQVIDYEHHEIYAGSHYGVVDVVDPALRDVRDIRIITPPDTTKWGSRE